LNTIVIEPPTLLKGPLSNLSSYPVAAALSLSFSRRGLFRFVGRDGCEPFQFDQAA